MIKSIKEGDNVAIQLLDDRCSIPLGIIDKIFAPIGKGNYLYPAVADQTKLLTVEVFFCSFPVVRASDSWM
ncbi:MAG: hypothetical protein VR65_07500 [Desulfobulbaceae bacterium BRH_c16a]|nr:MAG: hypothetical protein VR65_07500 [Desulfobulbaceae bacterium BRH_c16a]